MELAVLLTDTTLTEHQGSVGSFWPLGGGGLSLPDVSRCTMWVTYAQPPSWTSRYGNTTYTAHRTSKVFCSKKQVKQVPGLIVVVLWWLLEKTIDLYLFRLLCRRWNDFTQQIFSPHELKFILSSAQLKLQWKVAKKHKRPESLHLY